MILRFGLDFLNLPVVHSLYCDYEKGVLVNLKVNLNLHLASWARRNLVEDVLAKTVILRGLWIFALSHVNDYPLLIIS